MPELPEVETSRRGIAPYLQQQVVDKVVIRQRQLRWPIPRGLASRIEGRRILEVTRRGKYILLGFEHGSLILHLGMSGSLRITESESRVRKHDHFDLVLDNSRILRLHDPRRVGCVLWTTGPADQHELLRELGPEPLGDDFDGDYLYRRSRKRRCSVKAFIMNSHEVVGVGNIYANESLFLAGINPKRKAGTLSRQRCDRLVAGIKTILNLAIEQGGTTLRDFTQQDGKPGYFVQQLHVYGRAGEACRECGKPIKHFNQQQRSTFYCTRCQK